MREGGLSVYIIIIITTNRFCICGSLWFTVVRCGVIIPAGLVDVSLSSVEWQ